jgi:HTH-type transcriptional regulator / antitoxin HigA
MKKQAAKATLLTIAPIKPIRTTEDYTAALALVAPYFDNEPEIDSDAGAHFEAMVTLIEAYEAKHYPITPPDPIEAILFRMEQQGLKPKDLEPMIGQRNRVYEVLNRKRKLTMAMVWRLHTGLGIPAESLIRQPG